MQSVTYTTLLTTTLFTRDKIFANLHKIQTLSQLLCKIFFSVVIHFIIISSNIISYNNIMYGTFPEDHIVKYAIHSK